MFDSVKKIVMPVRKSDDELFAEAEAIVSQALSGLFEAAGGPQEPRWTDYYGSPSGTLARRRVALIYVGPGLAVSLRIWKATPKSMNVSAFTLDSYGDVYCGREFAVEGRELATALLGTIADGVEKYEYAQKRAKESFSNYSPNRYYTSY